MLKMFLYLLFGRVFSRTFAIGDAVGGAISSAIPIAAHYLPEWAATMNDLLWQVPIFALTGALILRLLCAPYELWREERLRADGLDASPAFDQWQRVNHLRLFQAACLWNGHNPPARANIQMPAASEAIFAVLAETLEAFLKHGHDTAPEVELAGLREKLASRGYVANRSLKVSRELLQCLALKMGEQPKFLFPDV